MNKITIGQPKTVFDPNSEFMRQLEIYKLKSEIKPRKVDMMRAQVGMIDDFVADVEAKRKLYVPNRKGGFIK
jgi:hypothetical protein